MQYVFLLVSAIGLLSALGTVLSRNLVHAALYLIAFFFAIACEFVLLEAEFLAALQVLVYIGAVAIILMFGIMLTRDIQGDNDATSLSGWTKPGLFAGACIFVVLAYGILSQHGLDGKSWREMKTRPSIVAAAGQPAPRRAEAVNNMAKVAGEELMSRYVVGFEVAGLLLTAALVGAVALASHEEEEPRAPRQARADAGGAAPPPPPTREAPRPVEAAAAH